MNFIEVLMALVIAYLESDYPLKGLDRVLAPARRKEAIAKVPALADALSAYDSGAEIDWTHLAAGVKEYCATYAKEPGAKSSVIKVLRNLISYYTTSSAGALKNLQGMSAHLQDSFIVGYFTRDVADQGATKKQLAPLVKKFGGSGIALTLEESKEAKEKDPEAYADYLKLRRDYNDAWKAALNNLVRTSGDQTVKYSEFLAYLKKLGLEHAMPTGFTGKIDAQGNWYTMGGKKIDGGVPSSTMFPSVKMNPAYDGDDSTDPQSPAVFQTVREDGKLGNYFYTSDHKRKNSQEKFAKAAAFDPNKVRKRWIPMMNQFNPKSAEPVPVAATILEILFQSSNRIGSKVGGNGGGGGYGICTLLKKHCYPQTNGDVKFIYNGKDDVKTTTVIKSSDTVGKKVCEIVLALYEGKKPSDPLFTYDASSGFKPVQPSTVNKLFHSCGAPEGVTVHKLRTVKGTAIFRQFLDNLFEKKKNLSPKDVTEQLKKGATMVGKELNHVRRSAEGETTVQPMTSLKNYIDPNLQVELFMHYGAPIPLYLEKLMQDPELAATSDDSNKELSEEEEEKKLAEAEDTHVPSARLLQQVFESGPESIV